MTSDYFNRAARLSLTPAQIEQLGAQMRGAIENNDLPALEKAIAAGGYPDANDGLLFRLCARHNNYLAAKALMLAGGDIGHALVQVRHESETIPRRIESGLIISVRIPTTEEGKRREIALDKEIQTLQNFQKTFMDTSLPLEQLNLLREIRHAQYDLSRRMEAMERALRTLDEPKPIEKKTGKPRGISRRSPPRPDRGA